MYIRSWRASPPRNVGRLSHSSLYLKVWEAGPAGSHALVARFSLDAMPPGNRNSVWRAGFSPRKADTSVMVLYRSMNS